MEPQGLHQQRPAANTRPGRLAGRHARSPVLTDIAFNTEG
jgi:hypothetical protein